MDQYKLLIEKFLLEHRNVCAGLRYGNSTAEMALMSDEIKEKILNSSQINSLKE